MTREKPELPLLPGKITVSRAAELLGLTRQTVHDMVSKGELRAWRVESGGSTPYPVIVDAGQVMSMKKARNEVVEVPTGLS